MKLKSVLFIAAGLLLILWASTRVASEILPALQPTSTPEFTVLEEYGPGSGPAAGAVSSAEIESQPVAGTLAPTPRPGVPSAAGTAPANSTQPAPATPSGGAALRSATPAGGATVDAGQLEGPFLAPAEPSPTPPPTEVPQLIPNRIVIPAIGLDAPVVLASSQKILLQGQTFYQWLAPDMFAAGWHTSSAFLGQPGNTVLDGHHNISGKVFGHLIDLNEGDKVDVYSGDQVFHWVITNKMILPERDAPISQRLENARWIGHSDDTRLTLITCWPADNNTHRLIVVAVPDPAGFMN